MAVSEELEQRVETLEEVVEGLTEQLEALVDTVDKLNKNQMSNLYKRLLEEGRLEEMRDQYPEMVNDLEQTAQEFIAPKIQEIESGGEGGE
jgi:ABC-type phosphate transport system auxiliary subunit